MLFRLLSTGPRSPLHSNSSQLVSLTPKLSNSSQPYNHSESNHNYHNHHALRFPINNISDGDCRLLVSHDPTREDQLLHCGLPPPCPSSSYHSAPPIVSIVTDQDRMKIVDWCYEIIDHCKMDRETVAVAMDIDDRFFSGQSSYIAQRALLHCRYCQLASLHDSSLHRD